jgi:hypothetical protein
MAFSRTTCGEFDSSRRWLQRTVLTVERLGDLQAIIVTTALSAWLAFLVGDWDQARMDGERAVALSRQADIPWPTRDALLRRGQLCLAEGYSEKASSYLQEAAALAGRLGTSRCCGRHPACWPSWRYRQDTRRPLGHACSRYSTVLAWRRAM